MKRMIKRCAGLDVHQATVVACVLIHEGRKPPRSEVRSFGTMTHELQALRDWLAAERVTHVGMESTGVYWRPVYAALEGHFELIVGNARHMRNVPGRKTDVKDAEWIAELVCCGLVRPSFVPPKPLRELREVLRYRRKLVEAQAAERNRLQKLLETANIKLGSVATDVFGVSGRAILRALIDDTASPEEITAYFLGLWRTILTRSHFEAGCAVLAVTVATDSGELLNHAAAVFRAWRQRLGELFEAGGLGRRDAARFAATLIASSEGAVVLSRAEQDMEPFELVAGHLLEQVRRMRAAAE